MKGLLCGFWLLAVLLPGGSSAVEPRSPVPDAQVARARFTTAVVDREPVDQVVIFSAPPPAEIYFFTDLRHLEGRTVIHRWEHDGQVLMQKRFEVKGPRWRVFSKKELDAGQEGEWSVTVVDESGWPLYTELFRYQPPEAGAATGAVPEPANGDSPESE
ncbi:MAG TPA: DUF2914 domain-containing protein [Gammaproteobacteria bacterium]|nr:DUF2914 domain-containing protein [Gammaproteobacteria bacterium]